MWILEKIEAWSGIEICPTAAVLFLAAFALAFLSACCRLACGLARRSRYYTRRVEFTLPERENSYVRARLHTALRTDGLQNTQEAREEFTVCLGYARELLAKVKGAPLSQAERLELEELEKLFALYFCKPKWTAYELRTVNDGCSRLLKLSAKYAV